MMKIAVAGSTGRVGRHVVDVLKEKGHDAVEISRSRGVDVITREGLAKALAGVECIIDVASGPSPEQAAATEFFTTESRNFQDEGARAGVKRIVVVSIIGTTLEGSSSRVPSTAAPAAYTLSAAQLQAFTRSGAPARAPVRRVGRARFRDDSVEGAASFRPKRWTITPNGDGPAAIVDPGVRTWSEYLSALKGLNRGGARWQIVPADEIEA